VLAALDRAMAAGQQSQKAAEIGQGSLFGGADDLMAQATSLPTVPPVSDQQRLSWEKESLGFFLSNHPFEAAARSLAGAVTANTSQITDEMTNERVTIAGAIMSVRKIVTKKQETMVVAHIEDLHGGIEAVVFPRTYSLTPELWREDNIVILEGKITVRRMESSDEEARGVPEILVDSAKQWDPAEYPLDEEVLAVDDAPALLEGPDIMASYVVEDSVDVESDMIIAADGADTESIAASATEQAIRRRLVILFRPAGDADEDRRRLRDLRAAVSSRPGSDTFEIVFDDGGHRRRLVGDGFSVGYTPDLEREIEAILGRGALELAE
jgi:DNA polymerase-3 subunit alpha